MSAFIWIVLGVIYFVILFTLGVTTLRKGHLFLFVVGIFIPVLWVVGALIGPTPRSAGVQ
jgi:hypothetical protein